MSTVSKTITLTVTSRTTGKAQVGAGHYIDDYFRITPYGIAILHDRMDVSRQL